jgi:hypothetical protein
MEEPWGRQTGLRVEEKGDWKGLRWELKRRDGGMWRNCSDAKRRRKGWFGEGRPENVVV